MPKVDVTPVAATVKPGKAARFTVVFLDNGGLRVGPETAAQVTPKLVAGKGQIGEVTLKGEGAVFTFKPYTQYCVIEVAGTGVIEAPRVEVRGEPVLAVMPHSIYEAAVMAVPAEALAVEGKIPDAGAVRTELDLGGNWRYIADTNTEPTYADHSYYKTDFDDSQWGQMKVPSNFALEDRALADFYGPVWFRRKFKLDPKSRGTHKRFKLRFEGADYFARVWLNGTLLGAHEGYFNPFEFDITDRLADGENTLAVRVVNPYDDGIRSADEEGNVSMCEKVWVKGILSYHDTRPGSIELSAKDCQTQGTGGIVRPVKVIGHGPVTIDWVRIDAAPAAEGPAGSRGTDGSSLVPSVAKVAARHYLYNHTDDTFAATLGVAARGEGAAPAASTCLTVTLPPGPSWVDVELNVSDPKLWWPWSHPELGTPHLYTLQSVLFRQLNEAETARRAATAAKAEAKGKKAPAPAAADADLYDAAATPFGIRSVEMSETGERAWQWNLNGKRIYFRGTNVIPTIWLSKTDDNMVRRDLSLLKQAHIDGVIVLDHHQPPLFYAEADREGMPVFQEFTLVWEYSAARHVRDNGDPQLTANVDVMKRMLGEALMLYHHHPSILWWSLHDEPFFTFGQADAGTSEIPEKPFAPGEKMPLLMDHSFNRDMDLALAEVARAFDLRRPWHASGNEGTNSTNYWGWYHGVHTDTAAVKEPFPIEFGAQAVPFSAEEFMLRRYGKDIWPPANEEAWRRWMFHDLQFPYLSAHIGKVGRYREFSHWAYASQLHQAAVLKYNFERFRQSRYAPTGSAFYFLFSSWWPSITWGTLDHNREATVAYRWLCEFNTPVAVVADPGKGFLPGGHTEIPVHLINDLHAPCNALLDWTVVETASSFVLRTEPAGMEEGFRNPLWDAEFPDEVLVLDRFGAARRTVASGQLTYNVGPDLMSLGKPVAFDLPPFDGTPRHYQLRLQLADQAGAPLAHNQYQFCVAGADPKALFEPGLFPEPRFALTVTPAGDSRAAGPQRIHLVHKHSGKQVMGGVMFGGDGRTVKDLPPGIYTLRFTFKGKEVSRDLLLDSDREITLDQ